MLDSLLIVGGGCYGLSTALSLIKGKYAGQGHLITVIDRCAEPPALDAASSDYNKIVRQDYSDETWARLAAKAIRAWSSEEWSPFFHQSGCMVLSHQSHPVSSYVQAALAINSDPSMAADGRLAVPLPTPNDVRKCFGNNGLPVGDFDGEVAYLNPQSGWANARGAMDDICRRVRKAGVNVVAGDVDTLLYGQKGKRMDVLGLKTADGKVLLADKVIVAAGSWSAKLVPELGEDLVATGHSVGHIQLTPQEAREYKDVPVVFRMDTGFYVFPPTASGIVKFAIHGPGYINPTPHVASTNPSLPLPNQQGLPHAAIRELRHGLERTYPDLAKKPWVETRMCWYCDSPSSDWLIDYHPTYRSLFLATGDSGHAFKFLPIIGDLIVSGLDGTLPQPLDSFFAWSRLKVKKGDSSRGGTASFARKQLGELQTSLTDTSIHGEVLDTVGSKL